MNGMTRIIAFALRAGGAAAGAFTLGRMPAEVYAPLLERLGIADAAWLTPTNEMIGLYAIGALFGLLFGSVVAGLLPNGNRDPVGTREEAAASVPRLRRHLGDGQGRDTSARSPLDRLSAPPPGQRLPKHDLSNIPPAPPEDEISFDRIPNTGVYADVESHIDFGLGEDDEDLKRFAAARTVDEPRSGTGDWGDDWDADGWGEDEWSKPAPQDAAPAQPAFRDPSPEENEFAAFDQGTAEPAAEDPQWSAGGSAQPMVEEQDWSHAQRPAAQAMQPEAAAQDDKTPAAAEEAWPEGIPMPPTLEEQGWGQVSRPSAAAPASSFDEAELSTDQDPDFAAGHAPMSIDVPAMDGPSAFDEAAHEEEWAAFNPPVPELGPNQPAVPDVSEDFAQPEAPLAADQSDGDMPVFARGIEPEEGAPQAPFVEERHHQPPQYQAEPHYEPEPQPEPQVVSLHGEGSYKGHDGVSAPRFAPGLTGGADEDWFAGDGDEDEDADDDGAGYGSLMAIGLGKTHKPRPKQPSHRLGEANLSHSPLLDVDRDMGGIPKGAGPQDFRLREALEGLKRF
ncbi:hypothetical protein GCM10010990_21500 [Croceicoccus mobilis]|uniref:Uncharacterized protein n=2 Tax=Croceicoccus mobilis TaxID=1703339 RepID=A0A916Z2P2_9SPHN|nr:hypothetical protein GCM10010990_21500 [Croceicoccus mobilis]